MRKLLLLTALTWVAACAQQSDTDVGETPPETGAVGADTTTVDTTTYGEPGVYGDTGMQADTAAQTEGDSALIERDVPDTGAYQPDTGAYQPAQPGADTGWGAPADTGWAAPADTGAGWGTPADTMTGADTAGTWGDTTTGADTAGARGDTTTGTWGDTGIQRDSV